MKARIFLTIIGLMYIGLALWCSIDPQTTSAKIGLELIGGSGQSEFLTVYGGLEFGLGLMLLLPWLKNEWTEGALLSCLLIHGSLAAFRTLGYLSFENIEGLTHRLAIGEWVILILSAIIWTRFRGTHGSQPRGEPN